MKRGIREGLFLFFFLYVGVVCQGANYSFTTEGLGQGIIGVTYKDEKCPKVKLMIEAHNKKYIYNINTEGRMEQFPLQLGNGEYKITLLKNTQDNNYSLVGTTKVSLELKDTNKVYLASIQNVNWTADSKAIKYAVNLTKGTEDLGEKAKLLYEHMVKNYKYDDDKLASLPTTYLPVIDTTFKDKTGICYDFSSLYAAMLRSQGIYAKLIKGYTPHAKGYHAWNEVYDAKKKKWLIIDTTYDLQVISKNPKITMTKSSKDYDVVYEY